MYAGMIANWHEVIRTKISSANTETLPLFMGAFSCDKGPETITDLTATDFFKLYGKTADYFKYGQPLTQAHSIVNAGGRVLGYRLCAPDATLANIIVSAQVSTAQKQKTNSNGQPLYIDSEGKETTAVTATPATVNVASVKFAAKTVQSAKTFAKVVEEAELTATDTEFPLLVIGDNGRGKSIKKFKITPDYSISKSLSFCMYNLVDIENTTAVESTRFAMHPDAKYNYNGITKSTNLIENSTVQFKTYMSTENINKYVEKLANVSGYSEEELFKNDILFGTNLKGVNLENIVIDETGLNLANRYGIDLQSGTNGSFGGTPLAYDAPFINGVPIAAWTEQAEKYFGGELTDEIYDIELHKVDFLVDANYPDSVKRKIEELVTWRKDLFYFRDLGLEIWSFDDIANTVSQESWTKSPFIADYMTTYEIIDPGSKKQIRVTMTYSLAAILVGYYLNSLSAPLAGQFNNFIITDAIEGTLNFTPRITPLVDQKTLIDDLRVNYANYSNPGILVVQSLYTSQDHWGPLSYSCNTIITQIAVKAVREYMPRVRFQQTTGEDLSAIKQSIDDNVLSNFKKYFKDIQLVYTADPDMVAQKIFNASIDCYYHDFHQGEIFDVYAIDGSPSDDNSNYVTTTLNI